MERTPSSRRRSTSRLESTSHARSSTRSSWRGGSTWYVVLAPHRPARDVRARVDLLSRSSIPHRRQSIPANSPASTIQVRNEIAVLKKISKGHTNIVTLHDYFEVCRRPFMFQATYANLSVDGTQPLPCLRSLHRWRALRSYMCQGQLLRRVSSVRMRVKRSADVRYLTETLRPLSEPSSVR